MLEWFLVESWDEHLRQHGRVSKANTDLQAAVLRFHAGPLPPVVSHFLALGARGMQGAGAAHGHAHH